MLFSPQHSYFLKRINITGNQIAPHTDRLPWAILVFSNIPYPADSWWVRMEIQIRLLLSGIPRSVDQWCLPWFMKCSDKSSWCLSLLINVHQQRDLNWLHVHPVKKVPFFRGRLTYKKYWGVKAPVEFPKNRLILKKAPKSSQIWLKCLHCLALMETWLGIPPRYLSLFGWWREYGKGSPGATMVKGWGGGFSQLRAAHNENQWHLAPRTLTARKYDLWSNMK